MKIQKEDELREAEAKIKEMEGEHAELMAQFGSASSESTKEAYRELIRSCRKRLNEASRRLKAAKQQASAEAERPKQAPEIGEAKRRADDLQARLAKAENDYRQSGGIQYATEASRCRRELRKLTETAGSA